VGGAQGVSGRHYRQHDEPGQALVPSRVKCPVDLQRSQPCGKEGGNCVLLLRDSKPELERTQGPKVLLKQEEGSLLQEICECHP